MIRSSTDELALSQTDLVLGILMLLDSETDRPLSLMPRQFNAVFQAADDILAELRQPERPAPPGCGLAVWWNSDQVGRSSAFMAAVLARAEGGLAKAVECAHPHDPDDFRRCLTLLAACPTLRPHLPVLAEQSPAWAALVGAWEELEALYREEAPTGTCPRLHRRLSALLALREPTA